MRTPRSSDGGRNGPPVGQVGRVGQVGQVGISPETRRGRSLASRETTAAVGVQVSCRAYQRNATPMLARQKLMPDVSSSVIRTAGVFSVVASEEFVALK